MNSKGNEDEKNYRNVVVKTIRQLQDPKGSTFSDIKRQASSKLQLKSASDFINLKSYLKNAADDGILTKLGQRYKVREAARRRKSRSRGPSTKGRKRRSRSRKRSAPRKRSGSRKRSRSRKRSAGRKRGGKRSKSRKKTMPAKDDGVE